MGAQILYDEKFNQLRIIKTFTIATKSQATSINEFDDGSWGYLGGDMIQSIDEVDFIPAPDKKRCASWLKNRTTSKRREKVAVDGLTKMDFTQLATLAGYRDGDAEGMNKGQLIEEIRKAQKAKE